MKLPLTALLLVCLATSCASTHSVAVTEEQMMARWMEFMTPGAGHELLAPKVGTWSLKVRMIPAPGAPAQESPGSSSVQWVMDGRYLQDTTMGDFEGQAFHGMGLTGYDNLKKVYVSTWIDNLGTGILRSEGHYDEATRTFHYASSMPEFMFANAYVPSRSTERWIDGDHWVMQNFSPGSEGEEFMSMEIEYTRVH